MKAAAAMVLAISGIRPRSEGFHLLWKRTSKGASLQPKVTAKTVAWIKDMAAKYRRWHAERMRGERLQLSSDVCKRTSRRTCNMSASPGEKDRNGLPSCR